VLVLALGLGAAAFLAIGFVVQQHAAATAPIEHVLSPRILLDLMRRPIWLAGIAAMVVGQGLGGAALRYGELTEVEPLLAANVLFALPLAAKWSRESMSRREWIGAPILAVGLGAFVWAASPARGSQLAVSPLTWTVSLGAVVAVAATLALTSRRLPAWEEATLLGLAAGCLYGVQDALTRKTLNIHGFASLFTSWALWLLVAVAATGIMLAQSAFRTAPLHASLPTLTIAEPLTGVAFGAGVYGETLRLAPWALAVMLAALAVLVLGVWLVARSPVVAGLGPEVAMPEPDAAPQLSAAGQRSARER
jgi:drug/metabolite transporter (DMT)-like permease